MCIRDSLGLAHAGDLRVGVDDGGDGVVAHPVLFAQDVVDGNLALPVGGVGQHGLAVDVAGGIDAGDVGAHILVGDDGAPLGVDADGLQTQVGSEGPPADGEEHLVGGDGLGLDVYKRQPLT